MKHRNDLTRTESRRLCLFLLNTAVIAGIAVGAVIAAKGGENLKLEEKWWLHQFFAPIYSGNTLLAVFRNTFLSSAAFLAVFFLLGFFSIGQPIGVALLIYRGVGIGASAAEMYILSGVSAVPSVMALLLPKALVLSFAASLGVREMLRLSCTQFAFVFRDELPDEKMKRTVKLYCIRFLVLVVLVMLAAVVDSAVNYLFMDLY